jgi:DnaJ-related protein SCJ1
MRARGTAPPALLLLLLLLAGRAFAGRDFYEVLGLEKTADDKAIKKAYRRLATAAHPDKNPDDPKANEKFAEIGNAYEVLSDPEKRQKYDMYGEDGLKPDGGGGGGGFGDFFGFGGRQQGGDEKRKNAITMDIEVTLQELYLGSSRTVRLRRQILCPACRGTGAKDGEVEKCRRCDGKGFTIERRQVGPGFIQQVQVPCGKCGNTGRISKAECPVCEGKKVQTGDKELEVYIEQGMPDGSEVLFEGEGDQGPGEAPAHIKFYARTRPHKLFTRDGDDLHVDVHISLLESLLGFSRTIEHLDGHAVSIERTGVTKPGAKELIQQEGMPVHNFPSDRGNLVANFIIDLPAKLTDEQKAALGKIL